MLEYDRIDVSDSLDFNKIDSLWECLICHYCYFLDIHFRFQAEVCNDCHDLLQKAVNFNDVAIVNV